jgi:hypothetical protein
VVSANVLVGKTYFNRGILSFFLIFGIDLLVASYRLDNPYEFIMCFFASSLIIMISAVGILYPAIRIFTLLKTKNVSKNDSNI